MQKLSLTQSTISGLQPSSKPYDVRDTKVTGFLARVRPSGVISYIVQYRDITGTQRSYTIGMDGNGWNATTAKEKAKEIRHNAERGADPHREKRSAKQTQIANKSNTLRAYFEDEYQYHLETKTQQSQKESRRIVFTEFASLLDLPMSEITTDWVREWRHKRRNGGIEGIARTRAIQDETLKRYNAELDVLLQKAVEDRYLAEHPLRGKIRAIKGANRTNIKPRFLSPDEAEKYRKALYVRDEHLKGRAESGRQWKIKRGKQVEPSRSGDRFADHLTPMCILSLNTGIRRGELFQLEWRDVATDYSCIELRAETTKTRLPRSMPLNVEARDHLAAWREQTVGSDYPLVFPNANGEVFRNVKTAWKGVRKSWKKMFDKEPAHFRWHDMRHDFASQLANQSVALNTIRELMGHATLKMTLRYAHLADSSLSEAVAMLDEKIKS